MATALIASATGLTVAKSLPANDGDHDLVCIREAVRHPGLRPISHGIIPEVREVVHAWQSSSALRVLTDVSIDDDGTLVKHFIELPFADCESP